MTSDMGKKNWELEQCRRVAEAINDAEGTDYEAQPSDAEPADTVLASKSKKFSQRPAQVVSIPLDFRSRDDKGTVEKLKGTLAELLRGKGMEHLLIGVIPSGDAEMYGVKQSLVEQLAEIVAKEACDRDLVLGYDEIYERSPELAEAIHNLFVSHHDVRNAKAVESLMLVIGVAGFVDDQQIEAFQRANPPDTLPFAEVWIVTPFHGVVCLKHREASA